MSDHPVGATWVGVDPKDGMVYTITLTKRDGKYETWNTFREYPDGSHDGFWMNWSSSYQGCRKILYLDGSGVRMKRVR
jgi:hypothetical protein